ncbi:metal ABC transporter permease [Persicimonas caeni]|uniref:Metal ABC transporter permease n=1 Tax=Persicimonas caeni TaxID=2292766 RepID=A0A4Y6Q3B0_PERCE|nr:metal ABC transporter permease [Persicimonas caeni]QDG54495.1 metal ABC transporter permease [Persicimonas caeni]QED35716.1 metal ABC transporter permease [Persicimonas caeni]
MQSLFSQQVADRAAEFFTFQYDFAINALMSSMFVGAVCAVVGAFLVLRGMSLLGDATGHATLPGVCAAFVFVGAKETGALLTGALVSAFVAALLVGLISRSNRSRPDAAIGVILSVFFGIGIVMLSYIQNSPTAAQSGLQSFLFGNAAGVSREQLYVLGGISAALIAGVAVFFRPLAVATFDPVFARSIGVPTRAVHYGLLGALSLAVVVSIQAVGVVLVSAMLIIPPSAALFLTKRLPRALVFAGFIGVASGALGAFVSYLWEGVATGPAMVIVAGLFFALAFVFGSRGVLGRLFTKNDALSTPGESQATPATASAE